jgi:hypothetical protein
MKAKWIVAMALVGWFAAAGMALAGYHHQGEQDSPVFLEVYPEKAGTKLDHCATCHSGGSYQDSRGRTITMGSCQWCHYSYGYDASGDIRDTMNAYGMDFLLSGRDANALRAIENLDSDGDGYTNIEEIDANTYPGNSEDHPDLVPAPHRIYTLQQLRDMPAHTQFMLMNTARGGTSGLDSYDEYTGVVLEALLANAGILPAATAVTAISADAWTQFHPLDPTDEPGMYPIYGIYPQATFYYNPVADSVLNPGGGWVDYRAPGAQGRSHGDTITVPGGLRAILAYANNGIDLDPGVLDESNRLQGEGPLRLVVPQKVPGPPDQQSTNSNDALIWPYDYDLDHNAGACTRSTVMIRVEPLPPGTTDIDAFEFGWQLVDQGKIIVYGNILATDSNHNGILDSEECIDPLADFDGNGIPDCQDTGTARFMPTTRADTILLHTSRGALQGIEAMSHNDPRLPADARPSADLPNGAVRFKVVELDGAAPETVSLTMVFPDSLPADAQIYLIDRNGWHEVPFERFSSDTSRIMLSLTDNGPYDQDPNTGSIMVTGALAVGGGGGDGGGSTGGGSSSGSGCFIGALMN